MWHRALIGIIATVLTACSNQASSNQGAVASPDTIAVPDENLTPGGTNYGNLKAVPEEMLGQWKYVRQECEEGEKPSLTIPAVEIEFNPDFTYAMTVEGWAFRGRFTVYRMRDQLPEIRLNDTLYEFRLADNSSNAAEYTLYNGSEGEAVYLCSRIFERPR